MNQNLKLTIFGIIIVIATVLITHYVDNKVNPSVSGINLKMNKKSQKGDQMVMHYTGTFEDGKKFDSSLDRGEPFPFILGAGQVIKGWDEGLVGLEIGEKKRLVIPPELGYGSKDNGPIPANSTLIFDVEVVDIIRAVSLKDL